MKVLLLNPNYMRSYEYVSKRTSMILPPLGLAYLASYLRNDGIEVRIIDLAAIDASDDDATYQISREMPDIVGITAATNTVDEAFNLAEITKEIFPKIPVVIGGPHASILPEDTLRQCASIDISVKGEGERLLLEICRHGNLSDIKGISYRVDGEIVTNPARPPIEDLDSLPFPARDLLPNQKYQTVGVRRYPFATAVSSRGCPYGCNFCAISHIHTRTFRHRSPENFVAEVDQIVAEFGIRELNILDDNFTLIQERATRICELLINRGHDLEWKLGNGIRADRVDRSLLGMMKKAGCYRVAFGIESGNEAILKNINKGETLADIRQAVKWAKQEGLETEGFFILGNDGDTEATMRQTIDFAKDLELDLAQFGVFIPFPGTSYTRKIEEEGRIFPVPWRNYNAFNAPIFEHGELTPELMSRMQKLAYRNFFFRLRYLIRRLNRIRSIWQLKAHISAALGIAKLTSQKRSRPDIAQTGS